LVALARVGGRKERQLQPSQESPYLVFSVWKLEGFSDLYGNICSLSAPVGKCWQLKGVAPIDPF
jgi:hypothetical protein